jgi:hypothetical protein
MVDIFCNPNLLSNIHGVDVPLTVHSTGGPRVVTQSPSHHPDGYAL